MNCDLWVQLDNCVSFVEEKVYVCITYPGKAVVIIYFSVSLWGLAHMRLRECG